MDRQEALPLARVGDRAPFSNQDTSLAAAREITPHISRLERIVLAAFRHCGAHGLTDEEGSRYTGLNPNTYRPRRVSLVDGGVLCDSRRRRKTLSGRSATVWVTAP